ncbi:beta transducin [Chlorella sorokiniana]|uniref:Beta transducin n=1 Tax=Chlorella sorokiniana TaxID=3076 RepID=A0A2P6TBQ6_CHLSO|nr:beta transducin [Chlorella sorokiniana]|eukprot:PRW18305.1 beta transducin [Chlorella sorokiniana]
MDVLGSRPGVIACLASYLVSQGLSMFSDLGHLTDSELVAGTPGLTSPLVQRLRWVWFARGWGEQQQLSAEEVALLEHDYKAMQEFYAMGAWS